MKITADVLIEDLVRECPQAVTILRDYGIRCLRCGEPIWGTLAEAAKEKGIDDLGPVLAALSECDD